MNKADFGVADLASLSPQHGLVIASAKLGQCPPAGSGAGTGAGSGHPQATRGYLTG